jgi:hypothetical protein
MGAQLRLVIVARKGESRNPADVLFKIPSFVNVIWHENAELYSMAAIGNHYLQDCPDVFGIVHADTTFHHYAIDTFWRVARLGYVTGMVGIDRHKGYIWSKAIPSITFVETLDCCSVFFRADMGLRFDDKTFDGFHCYVEDLCMQAHARKIPVVVPPAEASHHEDSTNDSVWRGEYFRYKDKLLAKWGRNVLTP